MKKEKLIRIVGPPRSGTNLAKFLVDVHTDAKGVFDLAWWKHGLPVPVGAYPGSSKTHPTIVMFRDLQLQLASLYKLSLAGAAAFVGDRNSESFLNSPALMRTPDRSIEYYYPNPVIYLLQFYHAFLSLNQGDIFFIRMEDLRERPRLILNVTKAVYPDVNVLQDVKMPNGYLARNPDMDFNYANCIDPSKSLDEEDQNSASLTELLAFDSSQIDQLRKVYASVCERSFSHVN